MKNIFLISLCLGVQSLGASVLKVGVHQPYKTIKSAIAKAQKGDTIMVSQGIYREGNISIDKKLTLIGKGKPTLDGEKKYEIISIRADGVVLDGFRLINSGQDEIKNIGAVRLYDSNFSTIRNCTFENNYFGIYLQRGRKILIENNKITSQHTQSQQRSGNAIHGWRTEELWLKNNYLVGHKDGIYLEQVKHSYIYHNYSAGNMRYGLHFMFAHHNVYKGNIFSNNNAGVAVMYSSNVGMEGNIFKDNWGDSSYGLLLKEISNSKIKNNIFRNNTVGAFVDGATSMQIIGNRFTDNGWGMKISASSRDSKLYYNNFINNTFDITTNGTTMMNEFLYNYWDRYEGYDLDKDKIGDVPYYPLSMYAVLTEKNPAVMLLYRTFFVDMMDRTERLVPSLTPENFVDEKPMMKPNQWKL